MHYSTERKKMLTMCAAVFLNKVDLVRIKIAEGRDPTRHVQKYTGGPDAEAYISCEFSKRILVLTSWAEPWRMSPVMKQRFIDIHKRYSVSSSRSLYMAVTSAVVCVSCSCSDKRLTFKCHLLRTRILPERHLYPVSIT